ncbi:MAG: KAP family P-loop NTPase fold protein [Gammaproteobacteria bacterium]
MDIKNFDQDLLDLRDFSKRLEKFIDTEIVFVDGSLVVALSSKFGSGKTTFLKMWKSSLEETTAGKPFVVSLNAWESDYYGDPLFAIISGMVESIQNKGESAERLINAAKDFGWFATAISSQVVRKITGIDPVEAGAYAESKKSERENGRNPAEDAFSLYRNRKQAMDFLRGSISEFISSSEPKVWFLIDELDRCRPDYAINYLETIKHIFNIKGAVFILAADRQQLENSARSEFGADLDFDEYYRKFIHREIALPKITDLGYRNLTLEYVKFYLEKEDSRFCFMRVDDERLGDIRRLIKALKLTPRQIQEVFRILGHVLSTSENNRGRLLWCLAVGSIVMAALKIGDPRIFQLLGNQEFEPKDAIQYIRKTLGDANAYWWFKFFLTGGGLQIQENEPAEATIKRAGIEDVSTAEFGPENLMQWKQEWGHSDRNRFREIHEKIEQIYQWN